MATEKQTIITAEEARDSLDELLDEIYPPVVIGDCTYYPSQILKGCDPIHYRIALADHIDYLYEDGLLVEGYTA